MGVFAGSAAIIHVLVCDGSAIPLELVRYQSTDSVPGRKQRMLERKIGLIMPAAVLMVGSSLAATPDYISERQSLAERHEGSLQAAEPADRQQAMDLALAMGIPADRILDVRLEGAAEQARAMPGMGALEPLHGENFAVLSTGSLNHAPRPGTAIGTLDGVSNTARLVVNVDPGPFRALSFRYRLLTAEYPDFAEYGYSDEFSVHVTDANGRRELTRMTADSSKIGPVSTSLAGGTPFDLYREQAGALEGDFSRGLPAAGISRWQYVEAAIESDGPVELEFRIRDEGDGLLDSAVIIDSMSIPALNMMSAPGIQRKGVSQSSSAVDQAMQCLSRSSNVVGAVADGETIVNLRASLGAGAGAGQLTFTVLDGEPEQNGGFLESPDAEPLSEVTVQVEEGDDGWFGAVQFHVPENFSRNSGDHSVYRRSLGFRIDYTPDDSSTLPGVAHATFWLWRPPLLLVHGLWSGQETWSESPLIRQARNNSVRIFPGDYSETNGAYFSVNRDEPAKPLLDACESIFKSSEIAMRQVDYAGHSMGGLLGRNFDTAYPGTINKFMGVNTPHLGSPLANAWLIARDTLPNFAVTQIENLARLLNHPMDEGALDDLAKGSTAINAIQAANMPGHSLYGTGGSDQITGWAPGSLGSIISLLDTFGVEVFPPGMQHDWVVGRVSQMGGLTEPAAERFRYEESVHTSAPGSDEYGHHILHLSSADVNSDQFGLLPPPSILDSVEPQPAISGRAVRGEIVENGVELVSPVDGTLYAPGDVIQLEAAAVDDFPLASVTVLSELGPVELSGTPFTGSVEIPDSFLGPLQLIAMGTDGDEAVVFSDPVEVMVATDLTLESIEIVTGHVVMAGPGDERQLLVEGTYSDGVVRNITPAYTGTTYQSADPEIVEVTENGVLIPLSEGDTTIVVQNQSQQSSMTATVLESGPLDDLFLDRFEQSARSSN